MSQPANNVQLQCASCGQFYQIQAAYQHAPHQCPSCGAMAGAQQPQLQQPQLQQQYPQPMPGTPAPPGAMAGGYGNQAAAKKSGKSQVVFIIRCVVGVAAVVTIAWTLFYVMNRGYNVTVNLGDTSKLGVGGSSSLNAGDYVVSPGRTFKATFKVNAADDEKPVFKIRHSGEEGASITEDGKFVWKIPEDCQPGTYRFNFTLSDAEGSKFYEVVKISFDVQ